MPGSGCCWGVGLARYFISAEELSAGSHAGALSCASLPRDSVAGFKNKCLENTHRPLISRLKAFHDEKWPSIKSFNKNLPLF